MSTTTTALSGRSLVEALTRIQAATGGSCDYDRGCVRVDYADLGHANLWPQPDGTVDIGGRYRDWYGLREGLVRQLQSAGLEVSQ